MLNKGVSNYFNGSAMNKDPWDKLDEEEKTSVFDALSKAIKNNIGLLVAGIIGVILVTILLYSFIGNPKNDNFNNTQDMFSECVPVNGRCP